MSDWISRLTTLFLSLSSRERLLVGSAGALLVLLLLYAAVAVPLLSAVDGARVRVDTAHQELAAASRLRVELADVQGRLGKVEERIRTGPRGNIFTALESMAREAAVPVDSMEPQASPQDGAYRETKILVTLKSVSLAQLANYLHRIESAPQLLSIKSLRIKTRSDTPELLDVTFSVSSFEPA